MRAGEVVGPYQVMTTLGRGGMGVVFRARDLRTGGAVALKTVRSDDERFVHGLRREIAALSRLHHPGVVRLVDQGEHEGNPWYAMDLLDGPTLREAAASATASAATAALPTLPDALTAPADGDSAHRTDSLDSSFGPDPTTEVPEVRPAGGGTLLSVLGLVHAICEPLAYLHGEGLVHRDLKPDNVVCRADGRVVLVDFGLLSHFAGVDGRDALAVDSRSHGTVSYLAPEVIRGEAADARADLYALGVILYEVVTGRVPFRSPSAGAVLYQHVDAAPVPPSQRADGVPADLDALILQLLAKQPHERLGYADDVRRALEAVGVPARRPDGPAPRTYLYRPRLVGRGAEMERIRLWLAQRPPGGACWVEGDAGMGKTRLLVDAAHDAGRRGHAVLTVEPEPPGAPGGRPPLHGVAVALADRCRHVGGMDFGPDADLLRPVLPALGPYLPPPRAVSLPPGLRAHRTAAALAHALCGWGDGKPTLLVCDDLQWAGDIVLALVDYAATHRPEGLVVLAAARPGLGGIQGGPSVRLSRLDEVAVQQMVSDMLGLAAPPEDLVRFVVERSEGVAVYVVELLRALVAEGLLVRDARGRWRVSAAALDPARSALGALRSPATLVALARSRVAGLGREALGVGVVLAAFGRGAARSDVLAVCQRRRLGVVRFAAALDELGARSVIVEARDELRFTHQDLRDAVWDTLGTAERVALHTDVARHMVAHDWAAGVASGASLAWQLEAAGQFAEAAEAAARAAERALAAGALDEAEALVRARIRTSTQDELRWRATLAVDILAPRGRTAAALAELDAARQRPGRTVADTLILAEAAADITAQIGRLDDAQAALAEALALLARQPDEAVEARIRGRLGALLLSAGHLAAAEAELRRSARLARATSSSSVWARAQTALASLALGRGRSGEATALAHRALRALRDTSDQGAVADALIALGAARARAGRVDEGFGHVDEALRVAGEDAVRQGMARSVRADIRLAAGDHAAALAEHGRALAALREAGHHRSQAEALLRAGAAHVVVGQRAAAVELFDQAAVLASVVGNDRLAIRARVAAAEACDDGSDAARRARQAVADAGRVGDGVLRARAVLRLAEVAPREAEPMFHDARRDAHAAGERMLLARLDLVSDGDPGDVLDRAVAEGAWDLAGAALARLGRASEARAMRDGTG